MTRQDDSAPQEHSDEITPLIQHHNLHSDAPLHHPHPSAGGAGGHDASSVISSQLSMDELALADSAIGERLAYRDYMTIDWLHDLVRNDSIGFRCQQPWTNDCDR
jgi:chloride channel 3/4/5